MSQEDVELVRRFWEAIQRSFDVYWQDPRPIAEALASGDLRPEQRDSFRYVSPEIVWRPAFLAEERRGLKEMAATWDDYLSWADDYRVRLEEVLPAEDGRVFAALTLSYRAKAGGGVVNGPLYSLVEVQNGLITRIDEYTERADALEAAGLSEEAG